jgi:hypothetical protein
MFKTYANIITEYQYFSDTIDAKLAEEGKSEISNGGSSRYLTIEIHKDLADFTLTISQTFSYDFSLPDRLYCETGLNCNIHKRSTNDFFLHFWPKTLWEKLTKTNQIQTGDAPFDKQFSARCSHSKTLEYIFGKAEIRALFLNNKSLLINAHTENRKFTLKLKDIRAKHYSRSEIQEYYNSILKIYSFIPS